MIKGLKDIFWPPKKDDLPDGELVFKSELAGRVIRADGREEDLGTLSRRVVTTAFVNYLVDCMQNSTTSPLDIFIYHDAGKENSAEAVGDTTLGTAWGGDRGTGTKTEGASGNIYKSVGTITFTSSNAIVEHGLFSAAAAGTLLDRSTFAQISVASDDAIEFTYQLTCSAGG